MSAVGLRPFLPMDARTCAEIFRASVEVLAEDDYGEEQRAAWSAQADDPIALGAKLADGLTLVAVVGGEPAGFATLKDGALPYLYVSPAFARMGVATTLLDALTKLARVRGAAKLLVDASDTARPLFARLGFVAERRNLVALGDAWLANTSMALTLPPADDAHKIRH